MADWRDPLSCEPTMELAVETRGLSKQYGSLRVLHALDLRVPVGSVYGFLGPNGAGKSTTIRILLGLLQATSGDARVLNSDAWSDGPRIRADIGYLPGDVRFYNGLTGKSTLEFFNSARGGEHWSEIERLANVLDFDVRKRVRTYSRGNKQKLGLIAALFHRPRLVILDEPTTALDPLVRNALNDELRSVQREGRTVLFSSHTLSEVEEICDRVAILRGGRLIEEDSIEALRRRAVRHVDVVFASTPGTISPPSGLAIESRSDTRITGTWRGPIEELVSWLGGLKLRDVAIAPPSLEDLFRAYYSGDNGAGK